MSLLQPGLDGSGMSRIALRMSPLPTPARAVPSQDGLRLIVAGMGYLLAICALQLTLTVGSLTGVEVALPSNAMDVRDVVALFGWVGLMISGVSVIIVPNHLRVRVHPTVLPRAHLIAANLGLVGFFVTSLAWPTGWASDAFLTLVSLSFLAFGIGILSTVLPFLASRNRVTDPSGLAPLDTASSRGSRP